MPSLDEAYERGGSVPRPRRVAVGLALVGAGGLAVLGAVGLLGLSQTTTAKTWAGIVAGLGVPAMLLGVVIALPADRRARLGVAAGTALSTAGVWLFVRAYPDRWTRTADSLALETLSLYALGCAVALWFVFLALASFRRRNDPQGTVRVELSREGERRTVEVSRERYRELVGDGGDATELIRELED